MGSGNKKSEPSVEQRGSRPSKLFGNQRDFLLLGNLQTGKSTLFRRMCGDLHDDVAIPGSSLTIVRGRYSPSPLDRIAVVGSLLARLRGVRRPPSAEGQPWLIDAPGTATLFPQSEEEMVARDALLLMNPGAIILVADEKNLSRSLALLLHAAQFGLPTLVVLNMADEASLQGVTIDTEWLSEQLNVDFVRTVALEGRGVADLSRRLLAPRLPNPGVTFPEAIESSLQQLESILAGARIAPRALAVQLLGGDETAARLVKADLGEAVLTDAMAVVDSLAAASARPLDVILTEVFHDHAGRLAARAVTRPPVERVPLLERFGRLAQHPLSGPLIAALVVAAAYLFVGKLGATLVVDWLNATLFEGILYPILDGLMELVPWPIVVDALMDRDFGVLPSGLFLAFGLVLPVLLFFYFAFALLRDSGYLARLSVLLDRLFRMVGLNGKGVLPLAMGFSCVTMALITTRMLESRRERIIASLILLSGVPCAPLLGVMLVILGDMPVSAPLVVFGVIAFQMLLAGWAANRLLPGLTADFIMEVPQMRVPRVRAVLRLTVLQTYHFMKEAVPYFVLASLVLFVFDRVGGLTLIERIAHPLTHGVLGLPDESVQVFIKTLIRRENGATELEHLSGGFTNLQLVVTMVVMTFLTPCVNAIIVLFKERGPKVGAVLLVFVSTYAVLVGAMVYFVCSTLGITFS